ncbi:MAG: hypothetical protein J07HR59_00114, partial [Halorubrum sp. J07HR59]
MAFAAANTSRRTGERDRRREVNYPTLLSRWRGFREGGAS